MRKIVMVLCVLAISSMAAADMTQDFETWVTSDLTAGNPIQDGWPGYYSPPHVYIDTDGVGTNTTRVVEIRGYDGIEMNIPGSEQRTQGRVSFDINFDDNQYGVLALRTTSYYEAIRLNFDDDGAGNIQVTDGWGAGGTAIVTTPGTWTHFEMRYDNSTLLWDLFVDGTPVWVNHAGYDPAYTGDWMANPVNYLRWALIGGGTGDVMYVDNVFIPEPATCLLLGSGLVLLRRRKRA